MTMMLTQAFIDAFIDVTSSNSDDTKCSLISIPSYIYLFFQIATTKSKRYWLEVDVLKIC